jgi:hypothetical protein
MNYYEQLRAGGKKHHASMCLSFQMAAYFVPGQDASASEFLKFSQAKKKMP